MTQEHETPLIFSWGDRIRAGSVYKKDLVSTIDLAPTLLDAAGIAKPEPMYGESLLPLLLGGRELKQRAHLFRTAS